MNNNIYRKLKEYISEKENEITSIFGTLYSRDCVFWYLPPKEREYKCYEPCGFYGKEYDFLLEYYVVSIRPDVKIEYDFRTFMPYLNIYLRVELEE